MQNYNVTFTVLRATELYKYDSRLRALMDKFITVLEVQTAPLTFKKILIT